MTERFYQTDGRLIVSRPGYNASSPELGDKQKIIDSNWDFSGSLIASGTLIDPAAPLGDGALTYDSVPVTITFPAPGFVPAAYVFCQNTVPFVRAVSGGENVGGIPFVHSYPIGFNTRGGTAVIYGDRIVLTRGSQDNQGRYIRYPGVIRYMVFGISQ